MASPDMIWNIVRDTSSFIVKQQVSGRSGMGKRGAEFTTEPLNPTSRNAFKYSGLANPKAVDVTPIEGGVQLVMKTKNAARAGKPNKALNKSDIKHGVPRKVAKAIVKNTETNFYRPDLTKAVLAKWSLLAKAAKKK